jgi:hypothetical protein
MCGFGLFCVLTRVEFIHGYLGPLGRTRLAFPRRIPGLKSETWGTLLVSRLNPRPALSCSLAGFFPEIDLAFLRVAINVLQFGIGEVEILHCIQ